MGVVGIDIIIFLGIIFQGVALNIGSTDNGFPIYLLTVGQIFGCFWVIKKLLCKKIKLKKYDVYIFSFLGYSILALVFTLLFQGNPVYNPRIGLDEQYENKTLLSFNTSNISQVIYLIINIITIQYFKLTGRIPGTSIRRFILLKVIMLVATLFALWQYLSKLYCIYYPSSILYSTKFGANLSNAAIDSGFFRTTSTFLECSFFGAFMSSVFCVMLWQYLLGGKYLSYLLVTFSMVVLSTSFSAIISLLISILILTPFSLLFAQSQNNKKRIFLLVGTIISALVLLYLINQLYLNHYISYLLDKSNSESYIHRAAANEWGWHLFFASYGLGFGLGSNATSSLLTYLLSNVGLTGAFLFALFILNILKQKANMSPQLEIYRIDSYKAGLASIVVTMLISQGTINIGVFWLYIYLICSESFSIENYKLRL